MNLNGFRDAEFIEQLDEKEYTVKEDIYYSRLLENGKKKGYINITEKDDSYYIEIEYNYGKIEAYSSKENLTTVVMNSLYILKTLDFNDVVIDSLIGENKIEYKEEKFNLEVSEDEEEYLGVRDEEDDSDEEDILVDEDTIELENPLIGTIDPAPPNRPISS